ncbi:flavin reductase family protein [Maritalea sp.]|uniref:flavin reductase family protein n=1 Tax=Maritalea sp. TaxID=2003361 RepID=UPI003EF16008
MTNVRKFRDALGKFATGVAVVTTLNENADPIGVTVNSFSSVSLDPPLVLWSLTNRSPNLEIFQRASHFVINILASDQEHVSNQFARPVEDRFANVECKAGIGGVPVLSGTLACFECENAWATEGGDHTVFFGKVLNYDEADLAPLLFFSGKYGTASHAN